MSDKMLEKMVADNAKATAAQGKALADLTKSVNGLVDKISRTPAVSTAPYFNIRTGEDPLTSRGFSYLKMLGKITGACPEDQCKVERDLCRRLQKTLVQDLGPANGYQYASNGAIDGHNRFLAPLSSNYLLDASGVDHKLRNEVKQLVTAGTEGADQPSMQWVRNKMLKGARYKDLSWLNELTGGALVAPPEMGELIELLRNKEALVNAGARTVPLPPQGRLKYPRQTSPSTTYWVGENAPITSSNVGTGEVTLQAKKLAVMIKTPNELIRFASPAAEALIRDDMTKSLALALDLAGLEGPGTDTQPRGVINYQNITTLTSSRTGADGDAVVGQDVYRMIAAVEEANAEFEGFIMRPKTLYKYYQLRADAVAQGDSSGPYLFNLIREAGEGTEAMLGGYPVTKSTQVSQTQAKGNATNLTYVLGGMWSDVLIGMFGAIEFAATTMGDTAFAYDQTWVRGILSADIQLRHESAFVLLNNLSTLL